MDPKEMWKEICFILSENVKPDISERDFENQVVRVIEKLGWLDIPVKLSASLNLQLVGERFDRMWFFTAQIRGR